MTRSVRPQNLQGGEMLSVEPGYVHEVWGWHRSPLLPHYWILICEVTSPAGTTTMQRIAIPTVGMVRVLD